MTDFLREHIHKIRAGVDDHNHKCRVPARAILLNPADHAKLEVDSLWGLPVLADERQRARFFRVDCEGSAWRIEEELETLTGPPNVAEPAVEPPLTPVERPLAAVVVAHP
jgi:hypothetical protein